MKAPDKIYVHVRTEPRPSITFSEVLEKNSTNEKYIREGALLEWVKNMKRICKGAEPIEKAYQTVIDKIKSL